MKRATTFAIGVLLLCAVVIHLQASTITVTNTTDSGPGSLRQALVTTLPASDDPNAHIFPKAAKHKHVASLSTQFREILIDAGLAEVRDYGSHLKKQNPLRTREVSEISFHSLRHSAVTLLKAAGVSDFIAREIIGHESAAVSRQYSHLSTGDLRNAMQRVPDVTR